MGEKTGRTTLAPVILALGLSRGVDLLAYGFSPIRNRSLLSPFHSPFFEFRSHKAKRYAVTKRQTAIFDGSEFVSIVSFLLADGSKRLGNKPEMPSRRAGFMTFVTGTTDENPSRRVVGVERPAAVENSDEEVISLGDDTAVYLDSVATVPNGISDADAISTAAAALCGIHCGMPAKKNVGAEKESAGFGKAVVLGGGDYACFTAKGLSELGAEVIVVTTRPMQLKDTPLNPLQGTRIDATGPAIGDNNIGFSEALGKFDVVIDTLGDEAKLCEVSKLSEGPSKTRKTGVAAKLRRDNNCDRYISTVTKSQMIVLKEGLFFARDPVVKYQEDVERPVHSPQFLRIAPPQDFGSATLQKLLDGGVVFTADRNEKGDHKNKDVFVRGCSFPDYAEIEIWPQDANGGGVRFGFPAIGELKVEAEVDKMMASMGSAEPVEKKSAKKKKKQKNPYVLDIGGLTDLTEEIVTKNRDCLLFVSAPYCKKCQALAPGFTRMARISKEETHDGLVFAKASTTGKSGKQLSFSLQVDAVPAFILFRDGERYGTPLGATRLPSKELDLAIEYLKSGKEWDPEVFKDDEEEKKRRTKLK